MPEIFAENKGFLTKTGRLESLLTSNTHFIKAVMIVMISPGIRSFRSMVTEIVASQIVPINSQIVPQKSQFVPHMKS